MKNRVPRLVLATAIGLSALHLGLFAQQTTPAPAADPKAKMDEDVLVLSPFTVSSEDGADSYKAETTLGGSRIRTDLRDVASSITVVTKAFMKDINATNSGTLLQYTPNSEVSGGRGNFGGGIKDGARAPSVENLAPSTRLRGLVDADNTRDYFLSDIPWDGYNIDRVELQRGPNSILFGVGSPAGIINTTSTGASFKKSHNVEARVDENGSIRSVVNFNEVLLPNELSVRVIGLWDDIKFQQKPAFRDDKRLFGDSGSISGLEHRLGEIDEIRNRFFINSCPFHFRDRQFGGL